MQPNMLRILMAIVGVIAGAVVVALILMFLTMHSIEPTQYGLKQSYWTQTVSDNPGEGGRHSAYTAGRYFFWPGSSFVLFPRTVEYMQFAAERPLYTDVHSVARPPLSSRTSDGLAVKLEVSMQYRLKGDKVLDIYQIFGADFHETFVRVAASVIMTEATKYTASDFFSRRMVIGPGMEEVLRAAFERDLHSTMPFFQLRSVFLPSEFEAAIRNTQHMLQEASVKTAERDRQVVQWQTDLLVAEQQVEVSINRARAKATGTVLEAEASVQRILLEGHGNATAIAVKRKADAESITVVQVAAAAGALAVRETEAKSIKLDSLTHFNAAKRSHLLQAQALSEVIRHVDDDEERFLELMKIRALQNVTFRKMTVNAPPGTDPLAYMGLARSV